MLNADMAVKLSPDRTLFVAAICLVSFGLVMLYSASAVVAHDAHRSSYFFLVKQSMWACVGLLLMLGLTRFDYRRLKHPVVIYGLLAVTVALLVGVLFTPPLKKGHRHTEQGDVVLLSPAGSSFDMFRDYRERGERFRQIVHQLQAES